MVAGISSLSASSIPLLFGPSATSSSADMSSPATVSGDPTGNTDDVFKAGNAIGKIIEIVAGMNASERLWTMEGAERIDSANGDYRLTKTGTGQFSTDSEQISRQLEIFEEQAKGTGPHAERARAYVKASEEGTLERYDMSKMGVTSIYTQTDFYRADGSQSGSVGRWNTTGMDEFLEKYVVIENEMMFDKATGKQAGITQNGTAFHYWVW
ncbi:hypothetical protein [Ciceribacter sp. L1K22]|uniref:hypothetical protein n=1 Tax=Ciceribacter sp. L1K22 TaxID=2820275 RepID=UPI001ABEE843|nr:hypothetical protein [Ciceribacter sp. L1K22]MBO3759349.1 hypothetical protein [Ciceribacter sp. L1K22]